jgi:hypothetical protein
MSARIDGKDDNWVHTQEDYQQTAGGDIRLWEIGDIVN